MPTTATGLLSSAVSVSGSGYVSCRRVLHILRGRRAGQQAAVIGNRNSPNSSRNLLLEIGRGAAAGSGRSRGQAGAVVVSSQFNNRESSCIAWGKKELHRRLKKC